MTVLPMLLWKFKQTKNNRHNTHAQNKNMNHHFSCCRHINQLLVCVVRHSFLRSFWMTDCLCSVWGQAFCQCPRFHPFPPRGRHPTILPSQSRTRSFLPDHTNQQTGCFRSPGARVQPTWKPLLPASPSSCHPTSLILLQQNSSEINLFIVSNSCLLRFPEHPPTSQLSSPLCQNCSCWKAPSP